MSNEEPVRRRCGDCSLCCKLARIDELDKPEGVWCHHCAPGRGGCTIHATRPDVCRNWNCTWIVDEGVGEEWWPLTSKMVLLFESQGTRLCVRVDPGHGDNWRREPYYSQLKQWSRKFAAERRQVVVYVKKRVIVILPHKDVDLGNVELGEQIWVGAVNTPMGVTWEAALIPSHVPPEEARAWLASRGERVAAPKG